MTVYAWWHGHVHSGPNELTALRDQTARSVSPVRELPFLNQATIEDGFDGPSQSWIIDTGVVNSAINEIAAVEATAQYERYRRWLMLDHEGLFGQGTLENNVQFVRDVNVLVRAAVPGVLPFFFRMPNQVNFQIGGRWGFVDALTDPGVPANERLSALSPVMHANDATFEASQASIAAFAQDIRDHGVNLPVVVYRDPALTDGSTPVRDLTDSEIDDQTALIEFHLPRSQHGVRNGGDFARMANMVSRIRRWQLDHSFPPLFGPHHATRHSRLATTLGLRVSWAQVANATARLGTSADEAIEAANAAIEKLAPRPEPVPFDQEQINQAARRRRPPWRTSAR